MAAGEEQTNSEGTLVPKSIRVRTSTRGFWTHFGRAEYLATNPNGLAPSIRDVDFVLWESLAINLYLAKKYGSGRLCPATQEGEALAPSGASGP